MGYTITFFNNGYGQELDPLYNITTIEDLPELTDEGFIFEGWYLDEELTTPVTYKMILTSDIILYASWTRQRYNWRQQGTNDTLNTYAYIRPEESITPSNPGGGGGGNSGDSSASGGASNTAMSTVSTSNYKGSSFFTNYLPSLADKIYKNGTDYGAWPIINLTNMYTCGGMTTTIPAKDTTDDPWVIARTYYGYKYKSGTTETSLNYVEPGTRPTFHNKLYEIWDMPSSYGSHVRADLHLLDDCLHLKFYNASGTYLWEAKSYAKYNTVDGAVPKRIIAVMQAAGAGGSNAYKSGLMRYSGCGGGSGACMAAVFKLDNIVGLQSLPTRTSTPVLRFYIPTITAANTSGKSFYVQIPLGSYSNPTWTTAFSVDGGHVNASSDQGSGASTQVAWSSDYSVFYPTDQNGNSLTSYNGTYYWILPCRSWYYSYKEYDGFSSCGGGNGGSGSSGGPGEDSKECYFYCSGVKRGTTSDPSSGVNDYLRLSLGNFSGGIAGTCGDGYSGGGGASAFAAGGKGNTTAAGNGYPGSKGSGGGGGGKKSNKNQYGTGGTGGGGLLQLWY